MNTTATYTLCDSARSCISDKCKLLLMLLDFFLEILLCYTIFSFAIMPLGLVYLLLLQVHIKQEF